MNTEQTLQNAKLRLAQHYLNQLREANKGIQKGQVNSIYWFDQIEQDWAQIQFWYSWIAGQAHQDLRSARLCIEYMRHGSRVLRVRQSLTDRIRWLEQALTAAEQLQDSAVCDLLHELGQVYFLMGQNERSRYYIRRLLTQAEANNDELNRARAWARLGHDYTYQGRMIEAEQAFSTSIALFEQLGVWEELGRAYQGIGRLALFVGNYEQALYFFGRYLVIVEESGRQAELAAACCTMAQALLALRRYEEAKSYVERAVQICQSTGFNRMYARAWSVLAMCEGELGNLETAIRCCEQGISLARSSAQSPALIELLYFLADALLQQGNCETALEHLQESLHLAIEADAPYLCCEIYTLIALAHNQQQRLDEAQEALSQALTLAQTFNIDHLRAKTLLSAIMIWQSYGELQQAARWAGLLSVHQQYVTARRFNPVCLLLEQQLGATYYQRAFDKGKLLDLSDTVGAVLALVHQPPRHN
jgi:tetratricopeptide (TPR) repeat protein